jgi:hypothetical protein
MGCNFAECLLKSRAGFYEWEPIRLNNNLKRVP